MSVRRRRWAATMAVVLFTGALTLPAQSSWALDPPAAAATATVVTTVAVAVRPMKDLGTLGGRSSEAYDINERGDVTGFADRSDGLPRAFRQKRRSQHAAGTSGPVWTVSGGMANLRRITNTSAAMASDASGTSSPAR